MRDRWNGCRWHGRAQKWSQHRHCKRGLTGRKNVVSVVAPLRTQVCAKVRRKANSRCIRLTKLFLDTVGIWHSAFVLFYFPCRQDSFSISSGHARVHEFKLLQVVRSGHNVYSGIICGVRCCPFIANRDADWRAHSKLQNVPVWRGK